MAIYSNLLCTATTSSSQLILSSLLKTKNVYLLMVLNSVPYCKKQYMIWSDSLKGSHRMQVRRKQLKHSAPLPLMKTF